MSHKHTEDKKKPGYPFTARQKRQAAGGRKSRKVNKWETFLASAHPGLAMVRV